MCHSNEDDDMNLAQLAIQMHHGVADMEIPGQQDQLAETRYQNILREQMNFQWIVFDDGESLNCRVFFPRGHKKGDLAPSVLFFHGGNWSLPNETEFVPWALHLSELGIVSLIPEYRMRSVYDVSGNDLLADAREMWAWVNENAIELGIDPHRITVAGNDAGGLMALHVALPDVPAKHRWFTRNAPLPHGPAALALFRGVIDLMAPGARRVREFFDAEVLVSLSPLHRLQRGLPPLFASHGSDDKILLADESRLFCREWSKNKNKAEFFLLDSADHSYMHFNVDAASFESTLNGWVRFMTELEIWKQDKDGSDILLL